MTPSEIAAYIGAAAWLPQIISWIYKALASPQVRLIPAPLPEVGYSSFGPIFNLQCAISTSRRDAIIEKIAITMRHERGQSTVFTWVTLNEPSVQIRSATGEMAELAKSQPAIALKVSTSVLAEKRIGFQDLDFHENSRALLNALMEHYNYLKLTAQDYADQTIRSRQCADYVEFYRRNIFWQEGRYTAEVQMEIVGNASPTTQQLEFSLTRTDVDRLNQNVAETERFLRDSINPPPPGTALGYNWNWINPALRTL